MIQRGVVVCPRPTKRRFPSIEAVEAAIRAIPRTDGELPRRAYQCEGCGWFHWGHVKGVRPSSE